MRFLQIQASTLVGCLVIALATHHASAEGAFAFGQYGNGGWAAGISYNAKTKQAAAEQALRSCNTQGYNCVVRYQFTNACFAYAVQPGSHNGFGYAESTAVSDAQQLALANCNKWGMYCAVKAVHCDEISEEVEKEKFSTYSANYAKCFSGASLDSEIQDAQSACDEALAYDRILPVDRSKLLDRKSRVSQVLTSRQRTKDFQEQREREFENNRGLCDKYIPAACLKALNSPLADTLTKIQFREKNNEGVLFAVNSTYCSGGSAVACDKALASPAAEPRGEDDRLRRIRNGLPFYQKAWAAFYPQLPVSIQEWADEPSGKSSKLNLSGLATYFEEVPRSTLIASFVAGVLAISLGGMFLAQRGGLVNLIPNFSISWPASMPKQNYTAAVEKNAHGNEKKIAPEMKSSTKLNADKGVATMDGPTPTTAYILNFILPGAGNIYFGQPIIGSIFILGILLGLFMFFFGASAAMLGILIIVVSAIAALFTFGLSLVIGFPIGLLFLLMGAGPIVAFIIWFFSLVVSEILVHSKASKMVLNITPSA